MIIKKQEVEANAKFDNAENAATVCIAMFYYRIDTHLELIERPPANLFCPRRILILIPLNAPPHKLHLHLQTLRLHQRDVGDQPIPLHPLLRSPPAS